VNHKRTADDYIFIVTHAQFIHYFVEANIIGARYRTRYRRRKAFVRDVGDILWVPSRSEARDKNIYPIFFSEIYSIFSENFCIII